MNPVYIFLYSCLLGTFVFFLFFEVPWWLVGMLFIIAVGYTQDPLFVLLGFSFDVATTGFVGIPWVGLSYLCMYVIAVVIKNTVYVPNNFDRDSYKL